ncbi:MBL fold metallo-hydrolase [Rhizobium sp. KVB221]|uniref:MBL fold metallo-hydrolase n=2 Tax=Rhizobium setariae TaxID=2801340 RepID=A0A937CQZ9_9HYPH|nr:MBL fold metallo-hydrolase [Rhizobium setariae]
MVEIPGLKLLVDCGMFQGSKTERELNYRTLPFDPGHIDAVILTHAHIDHSGLLPKLYNAGYEGPIFATPPTIDLCAVMLPDSGHIQESEVEYLNRRNGRRGRDMVEPIYTAKDAVETLTLFRSVELGIWQAVGRNARFRFWNAGHLLGSASVELEVTTAGRTTRLLFSGDLGPEYKLLEFDPVGPADVDYLICESTYGDTDRIDATKDGRRRALKEVVMEAHHANGALLIPSFAVERTQELLADLVWLMERREIPECPIVIDSPLATKASRIFLNYASELEDGDLVVHAMRAHNVRFTESAEQSKAIDQMKGFHIIIAASGMCEAGRIRYRLANWLWRDEGTVLLVGYQAAGTLGRILEEGATMVRIRGDDIKVRARIRTLDLYSGHADGPELAAWVRNRMPIGKAVFLIHGEAQALEGMRNRIGTILDPDKIFIPHLDSAFVLTAGGMRDVSTLVPPPRIDPVHTGQRDWHNDYQSLLLDLQEELKRAADDKARAVVIRKVRRALAE